MKFFSVAIILGAAATTAAQAASCTSAVAAVPSCGAPCINSAATEVGCSSTDYACQCSSSQSAAILATAIGCVISACGVVTGLQVSSAANAVCTACA